MKKKLIIIIYKLISIFKNSVLDRCQNIYLQSLLGGCGENVVLSKNMILNGEKNIYLGSNVFIGPNATFYASEAPINISNYVMIGPGVTFITGDHRIDLIGDYMYNVKEKKVNNDKRIVIEQDVWIGANVIILKGVTIGKGCVIGAGSIVTKDIPPYTVYVGSGEIKMWKRFDNVQLERHEMILKEKYK